MLIAQMLQRAGLIFMEAKGSHIGGRVRIDEIVCRTAEDAAAVDAWAAAEGYPVRARVASAAEREEYDRIVF